MLDALEQARSLALAAVRAGYFKGEANLLDVVLWSTPLDVRAEHVVGLERLTGDEVPIYADDATTLCAQGRALWHDLRRATALDRLDPAARSDIAAVRRELVLAFSPPIDRQAMLDAMAASALVLYEVLHAAA